MWPNLNLFLFRLKLIWLVNKINSLTTCLIAIQMAFWSVQIKVKPISTTKNLHQGNYRTKIRIKIKLKLVSCFIVMSKCVTKRFKILRMFLWKTSKSWSIIVNLAFLNGIRVVTVTTKITTKLTFWAQGINC